MKNNSWTDFYHVVQTLTHLVEVAENKDNSTQDRLVSVHCIKDLAQNKGSALTPEAVEASVKKVNRKLIIISIKFFQIILIKVDVESTAGVKQADSLPRSLTAAATGLLSTVSIWKCFGILAPGVADVNPINRDSIDIARQVVEVKKIELSNANASTIEAKQASMQFFNNLISQVSTLL